MAQERNERETAYGVAVQSLKNELRLAVKLLRQVEEARETMAIESHAINVARDAFRHAAEALDRIPQVAPEEMLTIHQLMEEFRSALADLSV
jgi:hypothetical protein